ncbi:hypothetical protein BJ138DRAFT_1001947 [Hygrophoropsis aurantiaca]|uniref:Uncharacterized protein n=1 Tax=Hygrophoropsis aurantiaca TaxID=72124 RepID=A0ACB8AKS8_9AGAM|nr:hypothetical protein BJ138DRAFT_1001947 [Hygrophoropsis aurantiaca]
MSSRAHCSVCSEAGAMRCARCKNELYCSQTCQHADWPNHKQHCFSPSPSGVLTDEQRPSSVSDNVNGIIIHCNAERYSRGVFEPTIINPSHAIYRKGFHASLFQKVGLPIIVYRHHPPTYGDQGRDNQIATYLMIESDGIADLQWQQCAGTVTVMRQDKKPLTAEAMETMWMYADHLLDLFSSGPSIAKRKMNPTGFVKFCRRYKADKLVNYPDNEGFKNMSLPL